MKKIILITRYSGFIESELVKKNYKKIYLCLPIYREKLKKNQKKINTINLNK